MGEKGETKQDGSREPSGQSTVLTSGKEQREGRRVNGRSTVERVSAQLRKVPERGWASWVRLLLERPAPPTCPSSMLLVAGGSRQVPRWRGHGGRSEGVALRGGLLTWTASLNGRNEPLNLSSHPH